MFFELIEEHLDLIPLEGECRTKKIKLFPELSRFFIQIERGVPDMFSFLAVFISFPPDPQVKSNTCKVRFSYTRTSLVQDEPSLLAVVSERWV